MAKKPEFELRVTGAKELAKKIRKMESKELRSELRAANKAGAELVAEAAEDEAPRLSGRLAKSVKATAGQSSAAVRAGTAARAPYAGPIHFGWSTRGIRANPFLYRGLAKKSDDLRKVYEDKIRGLAEKMDTVRG